MNKTMTWRRVKETVNDNQLWAVPKFEVDNSTVLLSKVHVCRWRVLCTVDASYLI